MKKRKKRMSDELDPLTWLSKKLETLRMSKYIMKIEKYFNKNALYTAHLWTPLKLITLMWWLTIYSRIVPKYFSNYWYIDLLASSGANVINETGDIILGSPLLSFLIPHEPFKRHIFIELDTQRRDTLDEMLKHFGFSNYNVLKGDCNEKVYDIPFDSIDHYFCFIDCEGLDVKWSTLEHLLQYRGDILLVFQTSETKRVFSKAKRGHNMKALNDFCGGNWWQSCNDINDLFNQYANRVKQKANNLRGFDNFVDYVRVMGRGGSFYYDVILICRKGPYVRAWLNLKERLSNLEDKHVKLALKICKGELTTLPEFFERKQPKLNDFFLGC